MLDRDGLDENGGNDEIEYDEDGSVTVPPFLGSDVRYLGFRFRSSSNTPDKNRRLSRGRNDQEEYQKFYMALSYIKVYRAQPEPEFIYLSDARIPPVIRDGMVHHQRRVLLTGDDCENRSKDKADQQRENSDEVLGGTTLFDERDLQRKSRLERPELERLRCQNLVTAPSNSLKTRPGAPLRPLKTLL